MNLPIPRRFAYLIVIGLVLLAVAGAGDALGNALRENYTAECDPWGRSFAPELRDPTPDQEQTPQDSNETEQETEQGNEQEPTPPTPQERQDCRDARLPLTIVDAITRAALGPGIAIVAISAVFLISAAIAARRR